MLKQLALVFTLLFALAMPVLAMEKPDASEDRKLNCWTNATVMQANLLEMGMKPFAIGPNSMLFVNKESTVIIVVSGKKGNICVLFGSPEIQFHGKLDIDGVLGAPQ